MSIEDLRFVPELLAKPAPGVLALETALQHFAIVTYWVDADRLRRHLHPRFEPVCLVAEGQRRALVSVVTFLDRDFRFVAFPSFTQSFGQTNYRAYVTDRETGQHAAWFFGTCLDSIWVAVPRYAWKLPWHRARMRFDCRHDAAAGRYSTFDVHTESEWSPGHLVIDDSGRPPDRLPGIANLEAALVLLTHPLRGFFYRQDGRLGSYAIWHGRTTPTEGVVREARYPLLDQLGLVKYGEVRDIHSVLLQPTIDFTIYLPPRRVREQ